MKTMPNIDLSRQELKRLIDKSFFSCGGESIICKTPNPDTLYKIFASGRKVTGMSENKERKIVRLYELSLEDSVHPLSTISCNGMLIGYEMTYDKNDIRAYPGLFRRDARIYLLQETARILQYFASKEIVYGDVAYRNILFNKERGKFKFCDIDNIQLEDYPIDLIGVPSDLDYYEQVCGIDLKTDAYMHNIMALSVLGVDFPYCYDEEVNFEFRTPASQIVESMKEPEAFTGEYIIQYAKKRR